MKRVLTATGIIAVLALFLILFTHNASAPGPKSSEKPSTAQPVTQTANVPGFDKKLHSIDTPGSIWWVVSKTRPLSPIEYAPSDLIVPKVPLRTPGGDSEMRLREEAAGPLEEMIGAAKNDGINLILVSGYRSYQFQVSVYNRFVQQYGQAGADRVSARPGTSEHQTGLAVDLGSNSRQCELEECFGSLPEGKWLAANAYKYGFVIRYPENKEAITGYTYEPWHLRYVGKDLSTEMHAQSTPTLEEFFNIVPERQPY